jgi:hypothetical protein
MKPKKKKQPAIRSVPTDDLLQASTSSDRFSIKGRIRRAHLAAHSFVIDKTRIKEKYEQNKQKRITRTKEDEPPKGQKLSPALSQQIS